MNICKQPQRISREEAIKVFSKGSSDEICNALVAIALYDEDWIWAQNQCLIFLNHVDLNVRGLAAVCLGHIARIHRKLDKELVVAALKEKLTDKDIAGSVQDALDDIEIFLKP